jgi:hypothetical protein
MFGWFCSLYQVNPFLSVSAKSLKQSEIIVGGIAIGAGLKSHVSGPYELIVNSLIFLFHGVSTLNFKRS